MYVDDVIYSAEIDFFGTICKMLESLRIQLWPFISAEQFKPVGQERSCHSSTALLLKIVSVIAFSYETSILNAAGFLWLWRGMVSLILHSSTFSALP